MNANYHHYHFSPYVEVDPNLKTPTEVFLCGLTELDVFRIGNIPVYFSNVKKAAAYLQLVAQDRNTFFSRPVQIASLSGQVILDPCKNCGFAEPIPAETIYLEINKAELRLKKMKELVFELVQDKSYEDASLVAEQILQHMNVADAEMHFQIGLIARMKNDIILVAEVEKNLKRLDLELYNKFKNNL